MLDASCVIVLEQPDPREWVSVGSFNFRKSEKIWGISASV